MFSRWILWEISGKISRRIAKGNIGKFLNKFTQEFQNQLIHDLKKKIMGLTKSLPKWIRERFFESNLEGSEFCTLSYCGPIPGTILKKSLWILSVEVSKEICTTLYDKIPIRAFEAISSGILKRVLWKVSWRIIHWKIFL